MHHAYRKCIRVERRAQCTHIPFFPFQPVCIIDFRDGKQNSLLPTFRFFASPLDLTRISFSSNLRVLRDSANWNLCKSFNRFTDAASVRIYYTLVCVSVSVHAHFLRFLSSPRPPPSYPPYLAYPSLILRIIDTGCYTCSMIGTSFRTNFLLVISLLHSFYMYYIIVTNENIWTVVLECF